MFSRKSMQSRLLVGLVGCTYVALGGLTGKAQTLPASTALPVVLTHSVDAGQSRPGDKVVAKTLQAVFLPAEKVLPAGTVLIGHVVQSNAFVYDSTPYAAQKPSVLSIHFDSIEEKGALLPVSLEARAIAGSVASYQAEIPHYRDEIDTTGTRVLIGGSEFSPLESQVVSPLGNVVGYNRKQGVFARLLAAESVNPGSSATCGATKDEQSVGIFSADACGAYGLNTVLLANNGSQSGTLVLESSRQTVRVDAGSAILLQETAR